MSDQEDDEYDDDDDGEDDEEIEEPTEVFVGMAFDRPGSEEAFKVIEEECKEFEMEARRAHQSQYHGSPTIEEVVEGLVDECHFAIIDLTHERPSVAHEIGLCDGKFGKEYILLIAKEGTPRFANIQNRMVNFYKDETQLRKIVNEQIQGMINTWYGEVDEDEEEEDE